MQQFYTQWRLVKYPYLLATPLDLCQNNYWQNINFVVRWGKAHNHHPLKWTAHDNNLLLIYLISKVFHLLPKVFCNFLFQSLWLQLWLHSTLHHCTFSLFFVANFNVNLIFHFLHLDLKKNLMVLKLWPIWKKTPIRKSAFILFIFSACPWMGVNLLRF